MRTTRLEAFSDGVFAIAATLLVLELRVPPDTTDLVGALLRLWPAYAAYLVSFLTIGIIWVNHHTLLEHCTRVDRRFLYLNLLLLIAVGIVPFPTSLVDQYILADHGATAALVVYGLGGILIAIAAVARAAFAPRVGLVTAIIAAALAGQAFIARARSVAVFAIAVGVVTGLAVVALDVVVFAPLVPETKALPARPLWTGAL